MSRDVVAELIAIRRALPAAIGMTVQVGSDPEHGLRAIVPEDAARWVQATPVPAGWRIEEVHRLGPGLPDQATVLADASLEEAPDRITEHFRRLQLQVRNAACGTPTHTRAQA